MREEIQKAIGSHALWKGHLQSAIASGKSEFTVADVAAPDKCEFAKWLDSLAGTNPQSNSRHEKVQRLHGAFHKEAARVLAQALAGDRDAAMKAMGEGKPYSVCSANLTAEMMNWARTEV